MIYFDYAAGAPVSEKVVDKFCEINKKYYANPNSNHVLGFETKKLIDDATNKIKENLNLKDEEIIYTSGASETNNLVIKGIAKRYKNKGKHILISALEHNSIVSAASDLIPLGFEVEIIPVNHDGLVDIAELKNMLREDTILVSVCAVDSEIGIRQPIEQIAQFINEYDNCYFHTDATQIIGKDNIDLSIVDLATITPHKFGGLSGIGILVKKKEIGLETQISGGKSTTIYRSGTPDFANIVCASLALDIALKNMNKNNKYIKNLSDKIKNKLASYKSAHINNTASSLPEIINFSIKNVKSLELKEKLESYGIITSTKTSCCPIYTPSKLVYALTKDKSLSSSSIRLSISHLTTIEEVDEFFKVFDTIYKEYEVNGKI